MKTPLARASKPLFLSILLVGSAASGQTWTGTSGTSWYENANWNTNAQPTSATTVLIDLASGNMPVISGGTAASHTLTLGSVTTARSSLRIENGGVLTTHSGNATIAHQTNSEASATVTGANSRWNILSSNFIVGSFGKGTLTISNGAAVSAVNTQLAYGASGEGTINLTGSGSSLSVATALTVGPAGKGTLNVSGGATLNANFAYIGTGSANGNGTVTVSGTGSTWTNTDHIFLGYSAGNTTGTLEISDGATVSNQSGLIGYGAGTTGNLTISNATLTNRAELRVGSSGTGTMTVGTGATVNVATNLSVAHSTSTTGMLTQNGGEIDVAGYFAFGSAAATAGSGTYRLLGGTLNVGGTDGLRRLGSASYLLELGAGTIKVRNTNLTTALQATLLSNTTLDTNGRQASWSGVLSGTGGLTKAGIGTLILSGNNSYQGATLLSAGNTEAHHQNAFGTGSVSLNGGHLLAKSGVNLGNTIAITSGTYTQEFAAAQSLTGRMEATSQIVGGVETDALLLAGTTGAARVVATGFGITSGASNDAARISDVYSIAGTAGDTFVLELAITGATDGAFLHHLAGGTLWETTDTGHTLLPGQAAYNGSFENFQLTYGTTLGDYIGAYGTWQDAGQTRFWAVVNEEGQYAALAVVPEPSTWALLGLAAAGLLIHGRRRQSV